MSGYGDRSKRIRALAGVALLAGLILVSGCHKKRHSIPTPPPAPARKAPPAQGAEGEPSQKQPGSSKPLGRIPVTPAPPGGVSDDDREYIAKHDPIRTEYGIASWYRSPYPGRKSANGQVMDDSALTAAHRTLPMGSLVVVTNQKTGASSPMRITDRGPFVPTGVIDLSIASAKATGVYFPGRVNVRVDVYRTPKPIDSGGRWCVQFGPFSSEAEAVELKGRLLDRYKGARVIEFPGEKSFWVRIRPENDDREQAEAIARRVEPAEGKAYLTRLD